MNLGKRMLLVLGVTVWQVTSALSAMPGAYQPESVEKPEVRTAADFAVMEEGKREHLALKLIAVVRAKKQIVAGVNYQLVMRADRHGKEAEATAIVFRGLDSHYELKAWHWSKQQDSGQ